MFKTCDFVPAICVRCQLQGVGTPVFDKLEAELAKAMMSLPATKGFEIGSGFSGNYLFMKSTAAKEAEQLTCVGKGL